MFSSPAGPATSAATRAAPGRGGHEVWVYDNLSLGHRAGRARGPADRRRIDGSRAAGRSAARRTDRSGDALRRLCARWANRWPIRRSIIRTTSWPASACWKRCARPACGGSCSPAPRPPTASPSGCRSPRTSRSSRSIPTASASWSIEQALADYAHAYGLGYAALRYFNAAGASPDGDLGEDHDPETHLIPIVLQVALGQREHITDLRRRLSHARRHLHSRLRPRRRPGCGPRGWLWRNLKPGQGLKLNLGTGRGHSVREVIDACRRVTGHPIPGRSARGGPGDPPELVADSPGPARRSAGGRSTRTSSRSFAPPGTGTQRTRTATAS